ncbi:MAG: Uracil-DNA glycosylase [Candidatus Nomurabacteria bacterium GW2011_GWA2_40_9]|uniref:Uracil-DNA glycosylase n=1 Tax=Candidatus Nomurabacteria bacterium GW2011_GWA2_40_9 TaxID=1618734 RepID=A0A0G0WV71_9BACT|nr:MAG: Uracil-DNA glycosylase [Candidatus Nomurabacteria bacterium GW2011_GWA2_40_9]
MPNTNIKIEESWKKVLAGEFEKEYFKNLSAFVKGEYKGGKIYPNPKDIFRAFDMCPFEEVKVVILGQDPYHGVRQANGLSFAVHKGMTLPPSLQNIFKEVETDLGIIPKDNEENKRSGDLSRWARQGVLLLNATLTVRASSPGSHQGKGWETFTTEAIKKLSDEREKLVFILWGNYAKEKGKVIDRTKHLVLESPHPSPFSAHSGFFGSRPFSKANEYLKKYGVGEVDWR